MAKRIYNVDSPVKFSGTQYHPDDKENNTIELSEKEAKPLLALNAISEPSEDEPEDEPTNKSSNIVNLKTTPEELEDRLSAIKGAVSKLDKEDKTKWTSNGMPDANVLTEMLGWKVKADERNQAWMEMLAEESKA